MYQSLSARRAWIEILRSITSLKAFLTSLSARRAWIEIDIDGKLDADLVVALRKESVDRNYIIKITGSAPRVALRKESVDRNPLKGQLLRW